MAPVPPDEDGRAGPASDGPPSSDLPPVIQDIRYHLTGEGSSAPPVPPSASAVVSSTPPPCPSSADPDRRSQTVALPVAAINALLGVLRRSTSETMMGLQAELREASEMMMSYARTNPHDLKLVGRSHIALASGCELFMK